MTFWDWLATPQGVEIAHVAVLLVAALAAVLSAVAGRIAHKNAQLLNGHLRAHLAALDAEQLKRGVQRVKHD